MYCTSPLLHRYSASIDTILLTPYNGDADLFVGKRCNFSDVEQNHYRWVSVKSGSSGGEDGIDSVTISKTDPNRCIPTVAKPCRYCIKVKNYESHSVLFSITGGTAQLRGTPENLAAGADLNGEVPKKSFRYYVFRRTMIEVKYRFRHRNNWCCNYVCESRRNTRNRPCAFPQRCVRPQCTGYGRVDRQTYTWRSYRGRPQMIQISPSDRHFCTSCNYIVGVYNHGPGKARFTVTLLQSIIRKPWLKAWQHQEWSMKVLTVLPIGKCFPSVFSWNFPQLTFNNNSAAGY